MITSKNKSTTTDLLMHLLQLKIVLCKTWALVLHLGIKSWFRLSKTLHAFGDELVLLICTMKQIIHVTGYLTYLSLGQICFFM